MTFEKRWTQFRTSCVPKMVFPIVRNDKNTKCVCILVFVMFAFSEMACLRITSLTVQKCGRNLRIKPQKRVKCHAHIFFQFESLRQFRNVGENVRIKWPKKEQVTS